MTAIRGSSLSAQHAGGSGRQERRRCSGGPEGSGVTTADLCRNIQLGTSATSSYWTAKETWSTTPNNNFITATSTSEAVSNVLASTAASLRAVVDGREVLYTAASSSQTGWTVVAVSSIWTSFQLATPRRVLLLDARLLSAFVTAIGAAHLISTTISKHAIGRFGGRCRPWRKGNFKSTSRFRHRTKSISSLGTATSPSRKVANLIEAEPQGAGAEAGPGAAGSAGADQPPPPVQHAGLDHLDHQAGGDSGYAIDISIRVTRRAPSFRLATQQRKRNDQHPE